jgi:DNA end-binding protein Ku
LTPRELEMAASLVTAMSAEFKPEDYKDEYRLALKKLIENKLKGVEIKAPVEKTEEIPDLMTALRASIEAAKKHPGKKAVGV